MSYEALSAISKDYSPVLDDFPKIIPAYNSSKERKNSSVINLNGSWVPGNNIDKALNLMISNNLTWAVKKRFDSKEACALLERSGIKSLHFIGDSYVRQVYAATLLTVTGDYELGAVSSSSCAGEAQFEDRHCRQFTVKEKTACDGKISFHLVQGIDYDGQCQNNYCDPNTLVIWSGGAHGIGANKETRYGVNNAFAYYTRRIRPSELCKSPQRTLWLSTHARATLPNQYFFEDEIHEYVEKFANDLQKYLALDECQNFHYVDVYNMTDSLVSMYNRTELRDLKVTYDGVHYGRTVNLLKVQIILNYILLIFNSNS